VHPIVRAAYSADRTAVAQARRFVRETLIGWGVDDAIDDAVLLTSELATNAVIHARTPFEVICRAAGGSVQIEVVDGDVTRVLPAPGNGDDPNRISGRGLLMPVRLAAEWGVSYAAASKTVWFRLGTRMAPPSAYATPEIPGVQHSLAHRPAGASYGGLYDVFEAAPDHWRFAIGGVCGTGPEASAVTGLARHGLRLLAAEGHGVADVLTRLNQAVVREGARGRPMTLIHGELVRRRSAGMRLTLVAAGHPPPLRLTSSGEVSSATGVQLSLGAVGQLRFEEQTVDLDPGDVLLCVTGETIGGVTHESTPQSIRDSAAPGCGAGEGTDGLARLLAGRIGVEGTGSTGRTDVAGGNGRTGLTAEAVAEWLSGAGDLAVLLLRIL
jgi:anti-sigma regulatory factor (Ser/Thr protein kinase)